MNARTLITPLTLALAFGLVQGCAPKAQNIKLDPPIQVAPASVGQGKVVWVQVADARPRKTLGIVGDLDGRYAHVSVEDDFSTRVYQRVSSALRDLGFVAQPTPGPEERSLRVEVRDIQYQSTKKTLTFDTELSVAVAALARNGNDQYDRIYNAGERSTSPIMPGPEDNARAVNRAVGVTLEEMLSDGRLLGMLGK
jgi:uncharacterized lipoprotein YajG